MAILEKFKYYSLVLFQYISSRFGILKFAGFAVLLVLLGVTEIPEWHTFAENLIFIFTVELIQFNFYFQFKLTKTFS